MVIDHVNFVIGWNCPQYNLIIYFIRFVMCMYVLVFISVI